MVASRKCKSYCTTSYISGPDIPARINNLSFKTKRWGKVHTLDTFSYTDSSMSKEFLSLKDLTLYTDYSLLQGDLTFHLEKETKCKISIIK